MARPHDSLAGTPTSSSKSVSAESSGTESSGTESSLAEVSSPEPVVVRQSVTVPSSASGQGAELAPRAAEPEAATTEAEAGPGLDVRVENEPGVPDSRPLPLPLPDGKSSSRQAARATRAESPDADPDADPAVAAGLSDPGDDGSAGRPRGSLLAAAGIAGALLIAVPLLILALADDKQPDSVRTRAVGGITLTPGTSGEGAVEYRADSSSPSPSPASPSPSPTRGSAPPAAGSEKDTSGAAGAGTAAHSASPKTAATKKKSAAATARSRANSASSQSRVLLKNVTTGQCADVPNYGKGTVDGPVNEYPCNGTSADNQLWDLVPHTEAGKGPEGSVLFLIRNSKDGLCMDLPYYGAASGGTRITEYPCQATKSDNQYYWLDPRSDGTYWIRNLSSRDLCLNVAGVGTGGNDAALQIGTCNDSSDDDVHWYFTRG